MPAQPAPSVRSVVELPSLGLVLRGGAVRTPDGQDRVVRWVAVSELEDPRSFLEGGELLLSTGMRLGADDGPAWAAYVERLVEAGVAAYGLGVGLTHPVVPEALLEAAAAQGLVVIEVPEATPFIAISKTVSAMVAAQDYEATTRAFETQRDLTRAALGAEAVPAVAARLARGLSAWVLVLDPTGRVVAASPAGATDARGRPARRGRCPAVAWPAQLVGPRRRNASGWCCTRWVRGAPCGASSRWGARPGSTGPTSRSSP